MTSLAALRDDLAALDRLPPGAAAGVLSRAGRTPEAMALLRSLAEDSAVADRAARALEGYGDPEAAWAVAQHEALRTRRAALAATLGRPEDVIAAVRDDDPAAWRATLLVRVGRLEEAEAALGQDPGSVVLRAWWALWRGDAALATSTLGDAAGASEGPGGAQDAATLRAALAILAGRPHEGMAQLGAPGTSPWAGPDVVEAWRARAWLDLGEPRNAAAAANRALAAGEGPTAAASLLRLLARLRGTEAQVSLPPWAWQPVWERVAALGPRDVGASATALGDEAARLLGRLQGNLSGVCTVANPAGLTPVPMPPSPRALSRAAQLHLRTRPEEAVLGELQALAARFPDNPTPWTYQGEVLVWSGRYAEAVPCFHEALRRDGRTTWGWIGLGAAVMLLGELREAGRIWDHAVREVRVAGPTLFIYRGEQRWRLGQLTDARADLAVALRNRPRRVASHVVDALAAADAGDLDPATRVAARLADLAPGAWLAVGADALDPVAGLRALLAGMNGNRSSALPAVRVDGRWWFLPAWRDR